MLDASMIHLAVRSGADWSETVPAFSLPIGDIIRGGGTKAGDCRYFALCSTTPTKSFMFHFRQNSTFGCSTTTPTHHVRL
jgi:hypothetical protein